MLGFKYCEQKTELALFWMTLYLRVTGVNKSYII